ncbi:hypothetical protein BKA62DRAFT_735813 [Auriculariales sp. MPI-PUGE-AT-0066]|nr:hypothetical protein BKA62DRAFT_735813 [Auriculariales sp. MPI-PUGE-AT-0066]
MCAGFTQCFMARLSTQHASPMVYASAPVRMLARAVVLVVRTSSVARLFRYCNMDHTYDGTCTTGAGTRAAGQGRSASGDTCEACSSCSDRTCSASQTDKYEYGSYDTSYKQPTREHVQVLHSASCALVASSGQPQNQTLAQANAPSGGLLDADGHLTLDIREWASPLMAQQPPTVVQVRRTSTASTWDRVSVPAWSTRLVPLPKASSTVRSYQSSDTPPQSHAQQPVYSPHMPTA